MAEAVDPDPPPPDPRLTFTTPYRNVKPGVRYVGDAACATCHADIDRTYHRHPMGRSAERLTAAGGKGVEQFGPAARPTFAVGGFDLSAEQTPAGLVHRVRARDAAPPAEYAPVVQVAVGSGTRGRSYLSVEDGGAVWQTALSWYGPGHHWDLSPGFRLGERARRAVASECLFCHVNQVEPVPGAENRYKVPLLAGQAAIGCERCHGPGELHVAERIARPQPDGSRDTSIVNPDHLPPALQAAVCEQCHLQGEKRVARRGRDLWEFRPGLPFELFQSVFVRPPEVAERHKSVGQFEQMEQSKCFVAGGRRMVCTTCHDPHEAPAPADADAFYRARCLSCHQQKGCSAPDAVRLGKADSCVACHMPKADSASIIHASVTDHRIPRVPAAGPPKALPFGALPLVRFRSTPFTPPAAEVDRDLGVALALLSGSVPPGDALAGLRGQAADRLTASLRRWPGDADAWAALAMVRGGVWGQAADRLKAAATAARLAPHSEVALAGLAAAATDADRLDIAEDAATKLVGLAPGSHDARLVRALVYLHKKDWEKAAADAREAVRLHPVHPEARLYLAIATHRLGDPAGARKLAQQAAALENDPGQRSALINQFQRGIR